MTLPGRIMLATRSVDKVREMQALLAPLGVALLGIAERERELGVAAPVVEETGATFLDNALIKARAYAAWAGLPVIAEDSGIEVDALDGRPGVRSARFAGRDGDDEANNALLLDLLRGVPDERRTASYRTVAVFLASSSAAPLVTRGAWAGRIGHARRGDGGFGYDPLVIVPDRGCTVAELEEAEKNARSHRGQAMRAMVAGLRNGEGRATPG